MKQFVKALPKGKCFKCLCKMFPGLSDAKLKEGIFVGPCIRKLLSDDLFETTMQTVEREAWNAFKEVIAKFLWYYKDRNYKQIVGKMLEIFIALGCAVSFKVQFLNAHLDYFPENLGTVSEEQGKRFHQDIKEMETRNREDGMST
jgi:hypothetical protein